MEYLFLTLLWIVWCAVHSWMTSLSLNRYLMIRLSGYYRFYRLFFNLFALITLIPLILYSQTLKGPLLFRLEGYWVVVRLLFLATAAALFIAGALRYDMLQFLGIRQIRSGKSHSTLSEAGGIDTSGILSVTRHPWYLATIFLVWAAERDIHFSALLVKLILSIYVVIGTVLEERKLIEELGDSYREYKKQVSMLFPAKWLSAKFRSAVRVR